MSENKTTEATEATEEQKPKTRKTKPKMIAIQGRIATTELAAGDVVEVERTPVIDKLLKAGFVEEIKGQ